jgi:hypothetical protein
MWQLVNVSLVGWLYTGSAYSMYSRRVREGGAVVATLQLSRVVVVDDAAFVREATAREAKGWVGRSVLDLLKASAYCPCYLTFSGGGKSRQNGG